jgi:hypothetical protein
MVEKGGILVCNRLRIDPNDGSPAVEYRIENGRVERGSAAQGGVTIEGRWVVLTAEQLASEVATKPAVACWLIRKLGVRALLRACSQRSASVSDEGQERRHSEREVVVGEFSPLR